MKILIVDDPPLEAAEALAQTLRAAIGPGHEVLVAAGSQQALAGSASSPPDVLITEAVLAEMDGFALRQRLQTAQPALQTVFLTAYDLSAYAGHLAGDPVLLKPADPAAILAALPALARSGGHGQPRPPGTARVTTARIRHLVQSPGFRGQLEARDLPDIVQTCCLAKRTGRLQVSHGARRGVIYVADGEIVHAQAGEQRGDPAVWEIVGWSQGQFAFDDGLQPEVRTVRSDWQQLLVESARRHDAAADAAAPVESAASLGPFVLRRRLGNDADGETFEAEQTSVRRTVALKVLPGAAAASAPARDAFFARARARAGVVHPSVLAVFEVGEAEGRCFYAREFVPGETLADLHAQGRTVDDAVALRLLRVTAEALAHFSQQKIPRAPLTAASIYLGHDGLPRVNNLALAPGISPEPPPPAQRDIQTLGAAVAACLPDRRAGSPELRALLARMALDGPRGFGGWAALLQEIRLAEPKAAAPRDAAALGEQERQALATLAEAKRRQRRTLLWSGLAFFALLWVVGGVIYWKFFSAPPARDFDEAVEIPAGEFIFQDGQVATLAQPVWMDRYEVTIGQYAGFLAALEQDPTLAARVDHPDQPRGKSHQDTHWALFHAAAKNGANYNGAPLTLDCPVFYVDWFDAYAFANVERPAPADGKGMGKSRARHRWPALPVGERRDGDPAGEHGRRLFPRRPAAQGRARRLQPLVAGGRDAGRPQPVWRDESRRQRGGMDRRFRRQAPSRDPRRQLRLARLRGYKARGRFSDDAAIQRAGRLPHRGGRAAGQPEVAAQKRARAGHRVPASAARAAAGAYPMRVRRHSRRHLARSRKPAAAAPSATVEGSGTAVTETRSSPM